VSSSAERFDVLVVGAGLSGIGAAYRLQTQCPTKSFTILEARSELGGTWDLFRYPGVRSDSDMFTLAFPFRPWSGTKSIVDGPSILQYLHDTARQFGIDQKIRFGHRVESASWSTARSCWEVVTVVGGARSTYRASFLYLCCGYYRYDIGYEPGFEGRDRFVGSFVHPQFWPEKLDHAGKRVVVIGSGATAVSLVPALAEKAEHVTMLQRSPTYMVSLPSTDVVADTLRRHLPAPMALTLTRWKNILIGQVFFQYCRRRPEKARALLAAGVRKALPGRDIHPDFVPRYDPWDQRMCVVPDGDFFRAVRAGGASVVTDHVARMTERGVELASGEVLEADIVVSATGLELLAFGGIALDVDGREVVPGNALIYKGFMLAGVPNLAFAFGYTNASFTLRSDLSSRLVCRLVNHMDRHGYRTVVPVPGAGVSVVPRPALDLTAGYVTRALDRLPKQGSRSPWRVRQNYPFDAASLRLGRIGRSLRFSPAKDGSGSFPKAPRRPGVHAA
jgi:monooxygenase